MAGEITDTIRFLCIGVIGWTVSWADGIESWARLGIALATAGYMTGKCIVIWSKIIKGNKEDEKSD
ncbi:hypothetical protein [uncultured Mediterranean phage uvMED]|nr:hypothetical protein [uncultured Mediterranean phage uvMED]BAQ84512.1 hypothetical protein [uncultured Mediterranean phage uvMED]BAR14686.1 hypothetical protein [uncultured Mediterranean phage uvMED]BAR14714.1 hypothetical protein [uncultured Mediterranean phage uvMED]BAR14742.1 hypothetical protein [uncultured Mediterranean phage uvMED]